MSYVKELPPKPDPGGGRTPVRYFEVTEARAGQRLDNYLQRELSGVPRSRLYRLIRKGEVRVNGRRASPELRLQARDRVRIPPLRVAPPPEPGRPPAALSERIGQSIVYEDDKLLVLDKPAGVAVHGGSGLSFGVIEALRAARPRESLELVHRLDRDTSGCLLIARHAGTLRTLHALLRTAEFDKRYLTLVRGRWPHGAHRIDVPLRTDIRVQGERTVRTSSRGKPAVSEFRPVQFFGDTATLMEVGLRTGRTHQIRVHAVASGHPVAGDEKYGDAAFNAEMAALGLKRMFLHAHSVSFAWPQGGEFSVNTPLPEELAKVLEALIERAAHAAGRAVRGRASPRRAAQPRAR
jgi:23S rRNA pseudouridine955/2504/2580 synthase